MLTSDQVAMRLGVTRDAVNQMAAKGCPVHSKGRRNFFDWEEVQSWRERPKAPQAPQAPQAPKGMLTSEEVARLEGVSRDFVNSWARKGAPHVRQGGRNYFDLAKVRAWRAKRAEEARQGRRASREKINAKRLEEARKNAFLLIVDTHFFFGYREFEALEWGQIFQPAREGVPPYDRVLPLQRALSRLGMDLKVKKPYWPEEPYLYSLPPGSKEKADELLGPALLDDDLGE